MRLMTLEAACSNIPETASIGICLELNQSMLCFVFSVLGHQIHSGMVQWDHGGFTECVVCPSRCFRPRFGKAINWIVVNVFFFLEHSLPHSYVRRPTAVGPCGSNWQGRLSMWPQALPSYPLIFIDVPPDSWWTRHSLSLSFINHFYPQTVLWVTGICFFIFPRLKLKLHSDFSGNLKSCTIN